MTLRRRETWFRSHVFWARGRPHGTAHCPQGPGLHAHGIGRRPHPIRDAVPDWQNAAGAGAGHGGSDSRLRRSATVLGCSSPARSGMSPPGSACGRWLGRPHQSSTTDPQASCAKSIREQSPCPDYVGTPRYKNRQAFVTMANPAHSLRYFRTNQTFPQRAITVDPNGTLAAMHFAGALGALETTESRSPSRLIDS